MLMSMEMSLKIVDRGSYVLALWLHTSNDPSDTEWRDACRRLTELRMKSPDRFERLRQIVVSDGGAPNQTQRALVHAESFGKKAVKLSLITIVLDNRVKKGISTALSWLNPGFKPFSPDQLDAALAHVDFAGDYGLFREYADMQVSLGKPIETLHRINKRITG